METILLTLLPPFLILIYFVKSDKFPEPTKLIITTFLLGIVATIPASFLNGFMDEISESITFKFAAAGFIEEPLKFLILYYYISKQSAFDEPMDGIVYGVTASLGFATYENIIYILNAEEYGTSSLTLAAIRAFSAVPMHALAGMIMGIYFGLHFFKKKNYLFLCLFVPISVHASYNYFVALNSPFLPFLIIFIAFFFGMELFKTIKKEQQLKSHEKESKTS